MADRVARGSLRFVHRLARVAFTFLMMNYSAIAGALAAVTRKKVWR